MTANDSSQDAASVDNLTPRMSSVLQRAADEARKAGQARVGTEHMLMALIADEYGLAGQVLRAVADVEEIKARLQAVMFPVPPPGFERYETPWGSAVVHDGSGHPRLSDRRALLQYFVDRHGTPVITPSGNLLHVQTGEDGRPVLDDQGMVVMVEVPIADDAYDAEGHRLRPG